MIVTIDDLHRNATVFLAQFAETPIMVRHMRGKRLSGPAFLTSAMAKSEIGCNRVDKATDRLIQAGFFAENLEARFTSGQPSFIFGIAFGPTQADLQTAITIIEKDIAAFTTMVNAAGSLS